MSRATWCLVGVLASAAVAGDVHAQAPARRLSLSFDAAGLVTLSASQVSVREILAEWARLCGCTVTNHERLAGGPLPMPVQFDKQPQREVLSSLLRQAPGYVLTPKRAGSTSVSNFETIYVLATTTANAAASTGMTPPGPSMAAAPVVPPPTMGSPDDEIPGITMAPPGGVMGRPDPSQTMQPNRPGMPTPMPQVQPGRPGAPPSVFVPIVPSTSTPGGTAPPQPVRPGMPTPGPTVVPVVPVIPPGQ